uniref:Ig-like domain-containing protein n=1 Tax=Cyclopterus lumpus TaxID=8103 RepID=A0A8C2ZLF4_CYCLU
IDRVQLTDGGSTLTINVTRYDQGPFSCRVSNPVSTDTSSEIQLSISFTRGVALFCVFCPDCVVQIIRNTFFNLIESIKLWPTKLLYRRFHVEHGPENINLISPSPEYYAEGSDIILSCSADSRPAPHFTWLLNGDLQKDTGADLRLMNIQMSQSGNYSCLAFNSKTLIRETSPPSFTILSVMVSDYIFLKLGYEVF